MAEMKLILKQTFNMILFWLATTFIGFFSNVVFTHFLNPQIFGDFTLMRTIINLTAIYSMFGLNHGLLRQGSLAFGKEKPEIYDQIKNYTISLSLIISIVVALLFFLFAQPISVYIFKKPGLTDLLKFSSLVIPIQLLGNMNQTLFQVNKKADKGQFLYLVVYFGLQLLIFYILSFFLKDDQLVIVSFVSSSFIYLLILLYYQRVFKFKFSFRLVNSEKKSLFNISLPMFFAAAINQSQRWIDTLFLGLFSTNANVGIYYIGLRISMFVSIPANAFNQIFTPIAGRLIGKGKHDELNDLYKTITRLTFVAGSLIFGAIFFLKEYILQIFGKGYETSTEVIIFILISQTIDFGVGPARQLITMSGGGRINLINSIFTLCVIITSSYLLIPHYGLIGAAIANALTNGLLQITSVLELMIIYKLSPFNLKYYLIIGLFTGVVILMVSLNVPDWGKFVLFNLILLPCYGFIVVNKEDILKVKELVKKKTVKVA